MFDYDQLPESLRGGMRRYVEGRIEPGSFLRAVLENDLVGVFACADDDNRAQMFKIAGFLYNEMPLRSYDRSCWGSRERVEAWLAKAPEGVDDGD